MLNSDGSAMAESAGSPEGGVPIPGPVSPEGDNVPKSGALPTDGDAQALAKLIEYRRIWHGTATDLEDANYYIEHGFRRSVVSTPDLTITDSLKHAAVPQPGERYLWMPHAPHAREEVVVRLVEWNGHEYWVTSENVRGGGRARNSLDRWIEATVALPDDEPVAEPRLMLVDEVWIDGTWVPARDVVFEPGVTYEIQVRRHSLLPRRRIEPAPFVTLPDGRTMTLEEVLPYLPDDGAGS